ncbi:hypothetical protein Taro_035338 [Colocasia esculenta]|uniref:non-specific serine/threonine protein kinase n=1 Tax=Colocasia esculenta TaxID=4460 RepID=A0A843WCX4_COLES|nr:hypothetical protein [Colocasia esculenta]
MPGLEPPGQPLDSLSPSSHPNCRKQRSELFLPRSSSSILQPRGWAGGFPIRDVGSETPPPGYLLKEVDSPARQNHERLGPLTVLLPPVALGCYCYPQEEEEIKAAEKIRTTTHRERPAMGYAVRVGKYQVGRTIGEGTFAKVKVAVDTETGQSVAIKILDKKMVLENRLMQQVKREISAMKLLHHPNIVRIYEVIATKTKIYIVMEYVSGGQLSDKMSYLRMLSEKEARKYFQQLIDAVEYCHSRGIYHRDLKPENLLIDNKGNLKVSDFGLSALRKPGDMLSTACGSPSYVAPEVIVHKKYEGAAADVWSCGVVLFELLAGYLPFEDRNTTNLYRKISRADYKCPDWFTANQKRLISRLLEPMPRRRVKVAEILEDEWFRIGYEPAIASQNEDTANLSDAFDSIGKLTEATKTKSPSFINAFQLIAMSNDLDLSGLFEEQDYEEQKTKLCSKHSITETIKKIEVAAKDASLSIERMNSSKVKLQSPKKLTRSISQITVSAEVFSKWMVSITCLIRSHSSRFFSDQTDHGKMQVIEVTPTHCMIEMSRSAGEIRVYKEFCKSLSSILKGKSGSST